MKLIIQNNRVAGTATDAYNGPDAFITAPDDFDAGRMGDYAFDGVEVFLPTPPIQDVITQAAQARLDAFAQTRNYDGILSACTYATSAVPQFSAEGQAAVNARDATWSTLYQIMGEVQAGTRPVPTSFADIEADLPELAWPVTPTE